MRPISRRGFVKTMAGATAAFAALGKAEAQATPKKASANERLGVALIGSGGRGRSLLDDFLRTGQVDVVAIADVDEEMLDKGLNKVEAAQGKRPAGYRDFRRVLERKDVDAVIVATPDHWHALPTIYACQAGKDVYVEKPLAKTIQEGRAMVNAARRYNRIVQVGTQQRSADHFKKAVEYVQSGKLGKIRMVRAWAYLDWKGGLGNPADTTPPSTVDYDFWLGPAPKRPFNPARFHFTFRWFWDYSGGLMTDWGAHMVDIAMWAMGEDPIGAMAIGGKYGYPDDIMETPDTQQSIVEFPSFSLLWEHMIGCGIGPWQREHGVEFHGQNGILVVDRGGWEVYAETDKIDRPDRIYKMMPVPRQAGSSDYSFTHVQNFVDSVKSRKPPIADVEIGHKSVIACHLANIAVRLRRYIRWDPQKEEVVGDPEAQRLVLAEYRKPWELPKI
ncbi:MAG: Gfo/Idh/MocA family oxidoreductase [candidate division KSB1 bacterium]|nr:Gfo/Idh/MocA family oxidoreductase [candidate division KSB1 bacterium]